MRLTRRQVLIAAGAGAAVAACGTSEPPPRMRVLPTPEPEPIDAGTAWAIDPASITEDATRFPIGVHAGAMTATGVRLSAAHDGPLLARVWRTSAAGARFLVHEAMIEPVEGHLKASVSGLGAGWYEYGFFGDNFRSPLGRFRTAFAQGDLRPLTIVPMTCTHIRHAPFTGVQMSGEIEADLYIHLGDLVYADDATNGEEYRREWRKTFAEGSYIQAFAKRGYYYTWDDHELANNIDPTMIEPARLAAAKGAAIEAMALETDAEGRIWRSYRWGNTAEIFVLDCRTERVPAGRETPAAQYISPAQFAWLESALLASPCKFKIIMNSVPVARMTMLWDYGTPDRWQGYEAQRARLLTFLETNQLRGVVFLSGDYHCGYVAKVEPTGWASQYLDIAVGPTGNGPNPAAVLADNDFLPREDVFPAASYLYGSGIWPATTQLTLDPLNDELYVKFVDARPETKGAILYEATLTV